MPTISGPILVAWEPLNQVLCFFWRRVYVVCVYRLVISAPHSNDGLTEWIWNSKLSLMHQLYNLSQKYHPGLLKQLILLNFPQILSHLVFTNTVVINLGECTTFYCPAESTSCLILLVKYEKSFFSLPVSLHVKFSLEEIS